MIKEGDIFRKDLRYSQADVQKFAEVTGDTNPVHLDEAYAAGTMFKKPIMHGFLGGSFFSRVFGTMFPGEGTLYLKQVMEFRKPMFVDTDYEAVFTVLTVDAEKHRATVQTQIIDKASGAVTINGEATVMNTEKI